MGKKKDKQKKKEREKEPEITEEQKEEKKELSFKNGFALTIGNDKVSGDYRNINVQQFSIDTIKKKLFDNTDLQISLKNIKNNSAFLGVNFGERKAPEGATALSTGVLRNWRPQGLKICENQKDHKYQRNI